LRLNTGPDLIDAFNAQDFAYVAIDVNILASSTVSDAVFGRVLVAILQAGSVYPLSFTGFGSQYFNTLFIYKVKLLITMTFDISAFMLLRV
jgi:hypothetical protein